MCLAASGALNITHIIMKVWFKIVRIEPRHEISNNVVCATSKGLDQPTHMRSLMRVIASRLDIL